MDSLFVRCFIAMVLLFAAGAASARGDRYFEQTDPWSRDAGPVCAQYAQNLGKPPFAVGGDNGAFFQCLDGNGVSQANAAYSYCPDAQPVLDPIAHKCNPAPPPPNCPIGSKIAGLSWVVGYRTGPSTNSPLAGPLKTPAEIANQQFCDGSCLYVEDHSPGAADVSVSLNPAATPGGYYPIVATSGFIGNGGNCVQGAGVASTSGQGSAANVAPPSVPSTGKDKCPAGTISGGIDSGGTPICIGTSTPDSATKAVTAAPVTTTNAEGAKTTVEKTTTTNNDGSETVRTVTSVLNPDGTTSRVVNLTTGNSPSTGAKGRDDSSGGVAGTATGAGSSSTPSPDKPSDLCKQHPELNICKNSSVSGSCEATACEGDAIECSILRTAQIQYCESKKDNALSDAAKAVANSSDPMAGLPTTKTATATDLAGAGRTLDDSTFLGGGSCFPDKTVVVYGRSLSLPFSNACPYLIYMRYAVMFAAAMGAYRMLAGTILRDI